MAIAPYHIKPNQPFRLSGERIRFKRVVRRPDPHYVFETSDRFPHIFSHEEIIDLRTQNHLVEELVYNEQLRSADGARSHIGLARATDQEKEAVDQRMSYILAWLEERKPRSTPHLRPLIDNVFASRKANKQTGPHETPPCVRTLQEWIRRYVDGGQTGTALVPQIRNRGNRAGKVPRQLDDIILDAIDVHYLQKRGCSIRGLHTIIEQRVRARNAKFPEISPLSEPAYETIRRAVDALCQYTVIYCRKGPAQAREAFRIAGGGIVTTHANEAWEIDDTRVDMICRSHDGSIVIGRPWLILVIDRHTRMIMGYGLSFEPPDTDAVMEVLRMAIQDKREMLRSCGIAGTWAASGKPTTLSVDNGKHYNSAALKRALTKLGVGLQTAPVLKAWYKGIVERVIGTTMRQVFHQEPGTTHSSIFERDRETPPETVAVCTLDEANKKLLHWIVNKYQRTHHKGIDTPPERIWNRSLHERRHDMVPTNAQLDDALMPTITRTLRKDGIEIDSLRYVSEDVALMRMLPKGIRKKEVIVRRDPNDLTAIDFLDAVSDARVEQWYKAYLIPDHLARVEGRTLRAYRLARALRRANPEQFGDNDPNYHASYAAINVRTEEDLQSNRLGPRQRAQADMDRQARATRKRTHPNPTPTPTPDGEDLYSAIGGGTEPVCVTGATAEVPASPFPRDEGTAEDFAVKHGLTARVRGRPPTNGQ